MPKLLFINQDSEESIDQVLVFIDDNEEPSAVLEQLCGELGMENPYIESVLEVTLSRPIKDGTMNQQRIDEIRARAEAATEAEPGTWDLVEKLALVLPDPPDEDVYEESETHGCIRKEEQ